MKNLFSIFFFTFLAIAGIFAQRDTVSYLDNRYLFHDQAKYNHCLLSSLIPGPLDNAGDVVYSSAAYCKQWSGKPMVWKLPVSKNEPIAVKGYAIFVADTSLIPNSITDHRHYDTSFYPLSREPEYIRIGHMDSNSFIITDSIRWDTANYKYYAFPNAYPPNIISSVNHLKYSNVFECYFDSIRIVDSDIEICYTSNSNRDGYYPDSVHWFQPLYTGYMDFYVLKYTFDNEWGIICAPIDSSCYLHESRIKIFYHDGLHYDLSREIPERLSFPTVTPIVDRYWLYAISEDHEAGDVLGGGFYSDIIPRTFSAQPHQGYRFVSWSDGDTHAVRSIVLTQDTIITAHFEQDSGFVGTSDIESSAYSISPNPAHGDVYINAPDFQLPTHLSIIDITGTEIRHTLLTEPSTRISLNGLAQGIYFLHFTSENGQSTQKLIVQ